MFFKKKKEVKKPKGLFGALFGDGDEDRKNAKKERLQAFEDDCESDLMAKNEDSAYVRGED